MKRAFFTAFMGLTLLTTREGFAQGKTIGPTPTKMTTTTKISPQIDQSSHLEKPIPPPVKQKPSSTVLPAVAKPPEEVPQHANYLHPGILVNMNNRWEGSDHLLNLSNHIGVYVEIIKPQNITLEHVSQDQLQKEVEAIFNQANIKPLTLAPVGKPPLPAFEIEIFVYPIERGYVICCEGRLFESVILERFKMDSNMAFQAVTWEKQNLVVSPASQFTDQITKTVKEIADAFVERFQAYEKLKKSSTY